MNKQDKCDHDWHFVKDWRNKDILGKMGETIEIPVVCSICGLEAREVYTYSCRLRNDKDKEA